MPDETKSNLEPIEEGDLNLKEKFSGGADNNSSVEKSSPASPASSQEVMPEPEPKGEGVESPSQPEQPMGPPLEKQERKEGMVEKDDAYSKILSKVSTQTPVVTADVAADAEAANREQDAQSKINKLVELAETKGIPHAVKVARHMEDNYVLDEFHDKLLGEELHDALVKKGLIKEI